MPSRRLWLTAHFQPCRVQLVVLVGHVQHTYPVLGCAGVRVFVLVLRGVLRERKKEGSNQRSKTKQQRTRHGGGVKGSGVGVKEEGMEGWLGFGVWFCASFFLLATGCWGSSFDQMGHGGHSNFKLQIAPVAAKKGKTPAQTTKKRKPRRHINVHTTSFFLSFFFSFFLFSFQLWHLGPTPACLFQTGN